VERKTIPTEDGSLLRLLNKRSVAAHDCPIFVTS